jgi:hypothetical protein
MKKLMFLQAVFFILIYASIASAGTWTKHMKIYDADGDYVTVPAADIVLLGEYCESSQGGIISGVDECRFYEVDVPDPWLSAVHKMLVANSTTCDYTYHEGYYNRYATSSCNDCWYNVTYDTNAGTVTPSNGTYLYNAYKTFTQGDKNYNGFFTDLMTVVYEYDDGYAIRWQRIYNTWMSS